MKLTERQQQALRGARIVEQRQRQRAREHAHELTWLSSYHSPGVIAGPIEGELPTFQQHGRGAQGRTSWSGTVPAGRILGPACKGLERRGLMESLGYALWTDGQRSETYALTAAGRDLADELLA